VIGLVLNGPVRASTTSTSESGPTAGIDGVGAATGAIGVNAAGLNGNIGVATALAIAAVAGSLLTIALKPLIGSAVYSTIRRVPSASIKL